MASEEQPAKFASGLSLFAHACAHRPPHTHSSPTPTPHTHTVVMAECSMMSPSLNSDGICHFFPSSVTH